MAIPTNPRDIDRAWLRSCLESNGMSAAGLEGFSYEPIGTGLIGDSYRLTLTWGNEAVHGAPVTLVAKMAASDPTSRATGIGLRNYEREVRFYREVAPVMPIRLAKCWAAEWTQSDGLFVLLLEDLSPAVVGDQIRGCSLSQAEAVVDMAAAFHASNWDGPALASFSSWMSTPADTERAHQLAGLWSMAWPQFLSRHDARLTDGEKATAERFGLSIAPWALARQSPATLVHGDFRTDNMLFGGSADEPWVVPVDWQTPGIGPGIGDVAYFLGASLLPDDRQRHEVQLVRRWFDGLVARGVTDYQWDNCWTEYRRLAFGGAVMGVVASMLTPQTERGDDMFFAMASRHLRQAIDNESVSLLPPL